MYLCTGKLASLVVCGLYQNGNGKCKGRAQLYVQVRNCQHTGPAILSLERLGKELALNRSRWRDACLGGESRLDGTKAWKVT